MKDNLKAKIAQLLDTKMDRKDFLKYIAAASVMAVGGGIILQSVGGLDKLGAKKGATPKNLGYGGSAYGGRATRTS